MTKIEALISSRKTVFTLDDLCVYWNNKNRNQVLKSAQDYVRRHRLRRIKSGIYALKVSNVDTFELAQKLVVPSYISGPSVLTQAGIVFQNYTHQVHSMALKSISYNVGDNNFVYHQLKPEIFFNPLGINKTDKYYIASPERAVADWLYFNKKSGFDNMRGLDLDLLKRVAPIYNQETMIKTIESLTQNAE